MSDGTLAVRSVGEGERVRLFILSSTNRAKLGRVKLTSDCHPAATAARECLGSGAILWQSFYDKSTRDTGF